MKKEIYIVRWKAAEKEGLVNLKEANSQEYVGIRMADMFIGLISKVMQSLKKL